MERHSHVRTRHGLRTQSFAFFLAPRRRSPTRQQLVRLQHGPLCGPFPRSGICLVSKHTHDFITRARDNFSARPVDGTLHAHQLVRLQPPQRAGTPNGRAFASGANVDRGSITRTCGSFPRSRFSASIRTSPTRTTGDCWFDSNRLDLSRRSFDGKAPVQGHRGSFTRTLHFRTLNAGSNRSIRRLNNASSLERALDVNQ